MFYLNPGSNYWHGGQSLRKTEPVVKKSPFLCSTLITPSRGWREERRGEEGERAENGKKGERIEKGSEDGEENRAVERRERQGTEWRGERESDRGQSGEERER
jgi:hypothetical protein